MKTIPIFLSSDNNYAPFVATTIASICDNTKSFCEFYILDGGISNADKEKLNGLKDKYKNFAIEYIYVDEDKYFKGFIANSYLTISAYYRFIIPQLKPDLDRVLYLDVDIIVKKDIQTLFDEDLNGKVVGAIKDDGSEKYTNKLKDNLEMDCSHVYFNSGILLIDCKKWRESDVTEKLFEVEKKYRGKLLCNDQDVLNKVFENNYQQLPPKYNSLKCGEDTVIRHYYAKPKPWEITPELKNIERTLSGATIFWQYVKETPYYEELYNALSIRKTEISLFGVIPFITAKTVDDGWTVKYSLLGVLPFMKTVRKSVYKYKVYLLGIKIFNIRQAVVKSKR